MEGRHYPVAPKMGRWSSGFTRTYFADPDAVITLVHQVQVDIFSNRAVIYPNKTVKLNIPYSGLLLRGPNICKHH